MSQGKKRVWWEKKGSGSALLAYKGLEIHLRLMIAALIRPLELHGRLFHK
jgi:hypothetical protein